MPTQWTDQDLALLQAAYEAWPGAGDVPLPAELLERHSLASSRATASRKGITRRCRPRQPDVLFDLSPTDAAYLAGLIDGEGHIAKNKPIIQITTTTPEITDWLLATVPIGRVQKSSGVTSTGKPIYRWIVSTRFGSTRLAQQVGPHMKIHTKVARMAELSRWSV